MGGGFGKLGPVSTIRRYNRVSDAMQAMLSYGEWPQKVKA